MAIGGGLGGLVIVVVALLLGVDPGTVLPAPQPGQAQQAQGFDVSQCKTGADANKDPGRAGSSRPATRWMPCGASC